MGSNTPKPDDSGYATPRERAVGYFLVALAAALFIALMEHSGPSTPEQRAELQAYLASHPRPASCSALGVGIGTCK